MSNTKTTDPNQSRRDPNYNPPPSPPAPANFPPTRRHQVPGNIVPPIGLSSLEAFLLITVPMPQHVHGAGGRRLHNYL